MIEVTIAGELKRICPGAALGCLEANVRVAPGPEALWEEIGRACDRIRGTIPLEGLTGQPRLKESRDAYKALGKDPSRYRLSSEALLRRILQGKELYRINNLVDINNLISINTLFSAGSYDRDRLAPPVVFTVGKPGDAYKGIGKEMLNLENLPLFSDAAGHFGSPTSDSERAMIRPETGRVLINIISFGGPTGLKESLTEAERLVREYAAAEAVETRIVE
jgi:DNA/RNA-binding domain of Phe-tRNA-synthetase-like protein